jgi:hypothetical protein
MPEQKNGSEEGIRTPGGVNLAGFQNRYFRPTQSPHYPKKEKVKKFTFINYMVRMVGIEPTLRNRNWILSPTRLPIPPHSHVFIIISDQR